MKCPYCQAEIEAGTSFCPFCGAKIETETFEASTGSGFNAFLLSGNKNLFLTLCILVSVSAGCGIISGSLPLFAILFTIFLWLTYAKIKNGVVDGVNIRRIGGTVFAQKVICWVMFGFFAFFGVFFIAFSSFIGSAVWQEALSKIPVTVKMPFDLTAFSAAAVSVLFAIVFFAAAAISVVFAVGNKKIHTFIKSLSISAQTDTNKTVSVNSAAGWLLAFGIIDAIGAVASISKPFALISNGAMAAAYIVGYILIKNTFEKR